MAKKNEKVATLEAQVKQVEALLIEQTLRAEKAELESLSNGKLMVGLMLYVRDAYVKTLTPQIVEESPFGKTVIEVLTRLEAKSPSVPCPKCSGTGCVDIRGNWMICYACVCGRILGKPGMMTVVDRKVQLTHEQMAKAARENRFTRYGPSQAEIEAAEKAKAEKAKASSASDIAL